MVHWQRRFPAPPRAAIGPPSEPPSHPHPSHLPTLSLPPPPKGPTIPWQPGRTDADSGGACPPDGRLPDASLGAAHIRDVFGRMGFNDREMVALSGAHTLGRCHADRSGFVGGPLTRPRARAMHAASYALAARRRPRAVSLSVAHHLSPVRCSSRPPP